MRLAGRVQAAIDVLNEVLTRHRPTSEALKDWGKAHRFAGSGDRHTIGTLVYDALRQKSDAALQGGGDTARHIILGLLRAGWGLSVAEIAALADEQHGPAKLSTDEKAALEKTHAATGNIPAWLLPQFESLFGAKARDEGQALSSRAPIDLRVNMLKADRDKLADALKRFEPVAGPFTDTSFRIAPPTPEQKHVNVEAEPAHGLGWFEVQDTASQIAAALSGVKPGQSVADICAGAGGKTLALAALMKNEGRLIAHDKDRHRLRPIFERITRAGATCVEVLSAENENGLAPNSFDCVLIDAPCSGTGAWRRKPETKWKLSPKTLDQRIKDQREVLAKAASLVKRGGTLVYITCSILPSENTDQIKAFTAANPGFKLIPYADQWRDTIGGAVPKSADGSTDTLLLTPLQHNVDGFFVAVMHKT
jgi:16S rRNA (cytosine967-C5)-methyltransferase